MNANRSKAVKNFSGAALAIAAASLFLASAAGQGMAAQVTAAKVQCKGVNACKGKSDCATASNACHGQNACKGQGWVSMSQKECKDKGGKIEQG